MSVLLKMLNSTIIGGVAPLARKRGRVIVVPAFKVDRLYVPAAFFIQYGPLIWVRRSRSFRKVRQAHWFISPYRAMLWGLD